MFDVIVVGVGTMGAATCKALARRGLRVLGLEQFGILHTFGAHHGPSRMFRLSLLRFHLRRSHPQRFQAILRPVGESCGGGEC